MRTRTKGIRLEGTERIIDKQYQGERIFQRLGTVSQDTAETWLRERQGQLDSQRKEQLRAGADRLWADGAAKYLIECKQRQVRTLELIGYHVRILLPYIGSMTMRNVCNEAMELFKEERAEDGIKNATINRSLEVVRTVMNRAARVWRDNGQPWLQTAPLIEMLDETLQRQPPYPISWEEQAKLVPALAAHLQLPVLFALNTGARDNNVCGLQWEWEVQVPELKRSVFVIPAAEFKGQRDHVLVLNDAAWSIVEACRGQHSKFVFVYGAPGHELGRIETINNTSWQKSRAAVNLSKVRVHDLRHTFGQRLRDAGVNEEDRALLLGHAIEGMPQHYATATVARLVDAANKVAFTVDRTTLLRVVHG